ncbi:MAG: hypothetical protein PHH09_10755 [Methanoregulaceae archaeon]|jgi:hypothetical protein|nr:hypothetical protein [Methanoregulaceae archaeon]MDD5049395.1 hypothetical protein [Methanoregulaceae archaeon]MDD5685235.1 hypothetical protein [Methanoregulaceae archaeon]
MFKGLVIVCLIFLAVAAPAAGMEISRVAEAADGGGCIVHVTLDESSIAGITEHIPPGSTVVSCSLPADQWRQSGNNLFLAVIGEDEVTYTVSGCRPEELSGTWIDLSDGNKGDVSMAGVSSPPGNQEYNQDSHLSGATPLPTKAGNTASIAGLTLAAIAFAACAGRRGKQ